ncbi:3-methylcrotonyl-CoA carboxylase [Trypanosoma theileri]|uniref:3-methylcrotonyl-CoA carboxylase n=1 Tax=Trypanosoma theileri TaxID=67003 RepID=A0A1X0NL47_9TRYP|nr:3-methylcrotonyl-CoA carboxylase [Trypanosoma theileri]ORC85248.1 3-methylcrotonyl-CoA carboxylase [Trypanosoma theileri]
MGDNSRVHSLIEDLSKLLLAWSQSVESAEVAAQLVDLYWRFMTAVHHDLVLNEAQGAALATASCIPVWEMLHFYSGAFGPLRGSAKAFVVTLLTALYPKTRDRRCLYQHAGCVGGLCFPRVPLSTRLPMSTEVMKWVNNGNNTQPDVYNEVVVFVKNTVSAEECILSSPSIKGLKSKVKTLVEDVLPRCRFVKNATGGALLGEGCNDTIVIPLNGEPIVPIQSYAILRETIWRYLILSYVYSPDDRSTLSNFLTTSTWSQKHVDLEGDLGVTYASIMLPIVHEAAVCASLMPPVASDVSDNSPLIQPRLLSVLLPQEKTYKGLSNPKEDLTKAFSPDRLTRRRVTITQTTLSTLRESLEESIPQEIAFSNESASCRDCDKLTQLCRSAIFSPIPKGTECRGFSVPFMKRILFDRKRKREDNFYEGPVLLPIVSSLSDMLEDTGVKKSLSTLERIVTPSDSI